MLDIKIATTQAEFFGLARLRLQVFVDEQKVAPMLEIDQLDDTAIEIVALNDGKVVGTARVLTSKDPDQGVIGRLAVDQKYRHDKIATKLLAFCENVIKQQGKHHVMLHAQYYIRHFYQDKGYQLVGQPFDEDGILHQEMVKKL